MRLYRSASARLNLRKGDRVIFSAVDDDGVDRRLGGLQMLPYAVPERCLVGYYPECNGLIPLRHYAKENQVPASKSVSVRVELQHQAP